MRILQMLHGWFWTATSTPHVNAAHIPVNKRAKEEWLARVAIVKERMGPSYAHHRTRFLRACKVVSIRKPNEQSR